MSFVKTAITGAVAMVLFSSGVNAASTVDGGTVNFKGSVVDASCGIAPAKEGENVEVDFGQVAKSRLEAGQFEQRDFSIKLIHCDVSKLEKKGVSLTFNGNSVAGTQNELATTGETGTAIVLNSYGKDVILGTATDLIGIADGDNVLKFTSKLKKATGVDAVAEGTFSAIARFKLTYE